MASASQETPPGLERTAVPGRLVLRHREGHGPCRFGGLSLGPAIAGPDGRPVPGLGCGNSLASGEGVSLARPVTSLKKPATCLKRRKGQEIVERDFCWFLKIFDSRWLEGFLCRAGDETHFQMNQKVGAFICNPLAGRAGCRKGGRGLFSIKCTRMSA